MKFFIPAASSDEEAERVLAATQKFNAGFEIPSPRIHSLSYRHNEKMMKATVGESADPYYRTAGPVVAILRNPRCFAICTADRGVLRGEPIYVSVEAVYAETYFDKPDATI